MTTTPDPVSVALWAVNLGRPLNGLKAWAAGIEAKMTEAKAAGAEILVVPEYASEQWLSFKPEGLKATEEIAWLADRADEALALVAPLAERHGLALLAGTMPARHNGGFRNRAWMFLPDGRAIAQDKLCLTPGEHDPEGWYLEPGETLRLIDWRGLRIAIMICLDIELPAMSAILARHEPDLILVPSMTSSLAGYSRVFGCAKARAVEVMAAVCAVGVVGATPGATQNPANTSGCAVFLPCEPALGYDGVFASTAPVDGAEGDGPFLVARDIPLDRIAKLRRGEAQVWPGAWRADGIDVQPA
jgi:predicted amidohydrolase